MRLKLQRTTYIFGYIVLAVGGSYYAYQYACGQDLKLRMHCEQANAKGCLILCNELGGKAGVGCIPTQPASADQVHTKNNKHTPMMVYDDLMIRNNTVLDYNINRSRPGTVQ